MSARIYLYSCTKDEKIGDDVKISDGHVSVKDYLKFKMKNMGNYHNHFLKKDILFSADIFEKFIDT